MSYFKLVPLLLIFLNLDQAFAANEACKRVGAAPNLSLILQSELAEPLSKNPMVRQLEESARSLFENIPYNRMHDYFVSVASFVRHSGSINDYLYLSRTSKYREMGYRKEDTLSAKRNRDLIDRLFRAMLPIRSVGITVHRGDGWIEFKTPRKGDILDEERGFLSTSVKKTVAADFADRDYPISVIKEITVEKGVLFRALYIPEFIGLGIIAFGKPLGFYDRVAQYSTTQGEVIFPRNQKFLVTDVKETVNRSTGHRTIYLKVKLIPLL